MKGSMNGEEGGWGRVYIGLRRRESRMFYEYCKWGPQPLILLACVAAWEGRTRERGTKVLFGCTVVVIGLCADVGYAFICHLMHATSNGIFVKEKITFT